MTANRTIAIRTDASAPIGTGHVIRCLAAASVLRSRGADVIFVTRRHDGNLDARIGQEFPVLSLAAPPTTSDASLPGYASWLGATQTDDARETADALQGHGLSAVDWILADHYGLDETWERLMRPLVRSGIAVIDDLANRRHDCNLLVDQNYRAPGPNPYAGLCPSACRFLLGPRFALLRAEFAEKRALAGPQPTEVRAVLVFFGGSDSTGETAKSLRAIALLGQERIRFHVVVGVNNGQRALIETLSGTLPNVTLHSHANMAELMVEADLALGAGGGTGWERFCLGLPSLVVAVAENQLAGAIALARDGYHFFLGKSADLTPEGIRDALAFAIANPLAREALSARSMSLVDGRGATRLAGCLVGDPVTLRRADAADCDAVHAWRNAPENREPSFGTGSIPIETHRAWFKRSLADPGRFLLIGESGGQAIGVLRYDVAGPTATVSVYLVPGFHGQGLGRRLLESGSSWLEAHVPTVQRIVAEVKVTNLASRKAFLAAGYRESALVFDRTLRAEQNE